MTPEPPTSAEGEPSLEISSEKRPERICPNCGAELFERKCKLLCPDPACGYFMSCADFL